MSTSRKISIDISMIVEHRTSNVERKNGTNRACEGSMVHAVRNIRRSTFDVRCSMFFISRLDRLRGLARDERGTISLMSVITIFSLMFLLGLVINAGREVDEKVRLQNAAQMPGGTVICPRNRGIQDPTGPAPRPFPGGECRTDNGGHSPPRPGCRSLRTCRFP